ncbi:TrbG/VirB9 family P-type conjugative transfer protein [Rubrivirga sp. S365]|uniref:TrbG/VirB9 family P-type conjugative transfer protein n=1 Tax=Rubrivirga sp. S365 TaxID=3076080 RepID=UPI0028CA4830|nr:TrbG/VirB9 family P-type conjugative transfer protein [Rubrivirga sp. S365]MDT7858200.1 TrbG/VirB9 family P-type conjugative transfer protein [Rubrivirga sp. S365]
MTRLLPRPTALALALALAPGLAHAQDSSPNGALTVSLADGQAATVAAPGPDGRPVGDGFTDGAVVVTPAQMEEALGELVREYERTGRAGVLRQSTVMTFPYGHSQPVLAAAPLRASIIELEADEVVLGVVAGDTERFAIEQTQTGAGGAVPLVVVKPLAYDVTTNLVISTDRRVYHVTLDAAPSPRAGRRGENPQPRYARHIRFYYPDDALAASVAAAQAARPVEPERPPGDLASLDEIDFDYRVVGDREITELVARVFDDGVHTYVQLDPERLRGGVVPVLYVQGPSGDREILNYAYSEGTYVADRTAGVFELALGTTVRTGLFGLGGKTQVERSARILHLDD